MPTKTIATFPPRVALEARRSDLAVLVGITLATGFLVLQGDVLGEIGTSDIYRRRSRTLATGGGFATTSPTGTVADASVFVAGDALKTAAGATIGTIAAGGVNTTTNTITLTANAATAAAAGAAVLGSDGSQTAKGIADESGNGEVQIPAFVAGVLEESRLRGLDDSAKTELGGASVAGNIFKF